ncbi:MAG TPA: EF-hand domain-containing protein [Gammaproteobacteria bacterium]|nr:EF-hand domain-containing protein [Gammaproteobacteria bacterium]
MEPTDEQIEELRESFEYNDLNGDGKIELDEFLDMLEALDTGVNRDEAKIGFQEIDTDHDGVISFHEFMDWWGER